MSNMDDLYSGGPGALDYERSPEEPKAFEAESQHVRDEIDAVVKDADVILYQTLHAGDKVLAEDGSEWTMASTNEIRISDDVVVERCNHDEESE
jgi:hypothetical protein